MIRIGICDDSPAFLQQTKFMIDHWDDGPRGIHTELFEDADAMIQAHRQTPFDILLLDVVMPLLDGIQAARELREEDKNVKIVFLTSSAEYAVDSYEVKASNYLLKPLSPDKFFACLDELTRELAHTTPALLVRSGDSTHHLLLSEIEYVEAHNKQSLFYLIDGRTLISPEPMYSYQETLSAENGFFRCHRSYIVNMDRIDTFTPKEALMRSGCRVPIARNSHKDFSAAYFAALFGKAGDL